MQILDIETAPLSAEEQQPFEPRFAPRANLTDPGKIKADIAAKRKAWHETSQLDGMRCRICAYGVLDVATGSAARIEIDADGNRERELLEGICEALEPILPVAGHNIGYDLGIIEQRLAVHGLPRIRARARNLDYYDSRFIDTKALWKPRASSVNTPANLDMIGIALGMGSKPGSGKDFWQWQEAKQIEYLTHDLTVCAEIARRML